MSRRQTQAWALRLLTFGQVVWQTVKMVAWSFLGIRRKSGSVEDAARANFHHIIVVGIVGAMLVVAALLLVVKWVVA